MSRHGTASDPGQDPARRRDPKQAHDPVRDREPADRATLQPGAPLRRPAMPGPTGPAETTEAVGDPDAHSVRSAGEGGAAAGAVVGGMIGGPIGVAVGAGLGAIAGAAAGPADGVPAEGERPVDTRADREAAYDASKQASPRRAVAPPRSRPGEPADPLTDEHATSVPVVDLIPTAERADESEDPSA